MSVSDIQIWAADIALTVSLLTLRKRPYIGWIFSFLGNSLFIYPVWLLHKPGLLIPPVMFSILSVWNICAMLNSNLKL